MSRREWGCVAEQAVDLRLASRSVASLLIARLMYGPGLRVSWAESG